MGYPVIRWQDADFQTSQRLVRLRPFFERPSMEDFGIQEVLEMFRTRRTFPSELTLRVCRLTTPRNPRNEWEKECLLVDADEDSRYSVIVRYNRVFVTRPVDTLYTLRRDLKEPRYVSPVLIEDAVLPSEGRPDMTFHSECPGYDSFYQEEPKQLVGKLGRYPAIPIEDLEEGSDSIRPVTVYPVWILGRIWRPEDFGLTPEAEVPKVS